MAKRAKNKTNPSFFPFVSVLIALIGVLIFIVLTLTVTSTKPPLVIESPIEYSDEEEAFFKRINVILEFVDGSVFVRASAYELVGFEDVEFNAQEEWSFIEGIYKNFAYERPTAWKGTPFLDFINDLAKNKHKTHFVSFLLRETGITEYSLLSDILNRRNGMVFDEVKFPDSNVNWEADWTLVYLPSEQKLITR
ncbi:hypothetical protein [Candidatus Thioglobus sp.]|jgi:hypothetical protein|uniref:hypothetical protein n=1 Tax=Candidatus Thioglobus sp. TaxID=2026721 RepID=UPI00176901C9|nr:hypothetical protein [Candidatus Thioglobus sp.]HIF48078.1 hypothetical protein [Candidatus Thioglobus sp.]